MKGNYEKFIEDQLCTCQWCGKDYRVEGSKHSELCPLGKELKKKGFKEIIKGEGE